MAAKCEVCDKQFTGQGAKRKLQCATCKSSYHSNCTGLSDGQFEALESMRSDVQGVLWLCRTCTKIQDKFLGKMIEMEKEINRIREEMNRNRTLAALEKTVN